MMSGNLKYTISIIPIIMTLLLPLGASAATEPSVQVMLPTPVVSDNNPSLNIYDATQVGRYTTIDNGPTQAEINPLTAISIFKFPPSVFTVGDAVSQVLATTGYHLSTKLSEQTKKTLSEPLPITVRRLGPMKIQTALEVLMGKEVYMMHRDPLNRSVNFKIKRSIARAYGVKNDE